MTQEEIEQKIAERLNDDSYKRAVYVFAECETGPCKIGFSKNPNQRIETIRKTHKMPNLKIFWYRFHQNAPQVEWSIHGAFRKRSLGKEVFAVTVEEAIQIAEKMVEKIRPVEEFWRKNPQYLDPAFKPTWNRVSGNKHWARRAKMARLAVIA